VSGQVHGTRAIVAAFLANLGIAVLKFVGFVFTGSGSMLAESVHSVADTGNQFLLLVGHRKADAVRNATFGVRIGDITISVGAVIGAILLFVVALVLFTVGALFSIADGVEKLFNPHEIESPASAIVILLIAVVLEGLSFRTGVQESNEIRGTATWWQFIRRAKNPELPILLLEDTAALIGLALALAAVGLSELTGDPVWDAYGTLAIGVLLAVVAAVLAVEMRSLLLGAAPEVARTIATAIEEHPDVRRLIHLRTEHLGPEELLVAAKIEFSPDLSIRELADVVNSVEAAVRALVPEARVMYLEPDVLRSAGAE